MCISNKVHFIYSFPPLLKIHLFFHDIYNWVKVAYSFLIILHVFGMPLTSWPWYVILYQIIFYLPTVSLIFIQDIVSLYLSTWCSGKVLIHVVEDLDTVIPKAKKKKKKKIQTRLQYNWFWKNLNQRIQKKIKGFHRFYGVFSWRCFRSLYQYFWI